MEIIRVREKIYHRFNRPSVALGNFDGIHLGHQEILRRTVERAHNKNRDAVVYTFDPHPRVVLNAAPDVPRITTLSERAEILEFMGIDVLVLAEFTREFASQTAREFVENILVEELGTTDLYVGENYRFGKGRAGSPETLKEMGPQAGFRAHVVQCVVKSDERVSSSRIRDHLLKGEIYAANRLLGREFTVEGKVIHGHHRGKKLGFPTANLKPQEKLVPPHGVYAAYCRVDERSYPAVMNIGLNPTFMDRRVSYEVHILNFEGNLYGRNLKVYLKDRLRPEMKFNGPEELKAQIAKDIHRCRGMLTILPTFP
ncbi:bifunctional riboflavin kinase/FAD synthetase [Thermodesulfobacteriota bacterium]